ncbi:MAG: hypothetical protein KDK54_22515 [Leptospiraceae bacterium]|nr:hypothetical protein [Leptospiraceae bacterium]
MKNKINTFVCANENFESLFMRTVLYTRKIILYSCLIGGWNCRYSWKVGEIVERKDVRIKKNSLKTADSLQFLKMNLSQ